MSDDDARKAPPPLPPRTEPPPWIADELLPLLQGAGEEVAAVPAVVRRRLIDRVRRSASAARAMFTVRHAAADVSTPAAGVVLRTLYAAGRGASRRPGEPERTALVELAPGACWPDAGTDTTLQRAWLVLQGCATLGDLTLQREDHALVGCGVPPARLASAGGALLLLREARLADTGRPTVAVQAAARADWQVYAPGIHRRVLWQQAGQAAMLYRTAPGATVPAHGHCHDEECLMVEGEVFLDDVLLRTLDYQLAPAGTAHTGVWTDTGVLIYAHGDAELDLHGDIELDLHGG